MVKGEEKNTSKRKRKAGMVRTFSFVRHRHGFEPWMTCLPLA